MHKKLNAVMQMDPPGGRRRPARNPIAELQQQQQQEQQQHQLQQQKDPSPSPADPDSSNDAAAHSGNNSPECRRSSRKKTIKFDVRDLLNKNRKSHKIQIEARIDSNAPKVGGIGQLNKAELDSKQKNFIEKSAIFRRYSISENKLPPRPPPPPGALIHTIQQCVGELEQLPLEGGELNMAAISPIARRLSRTQDILTASMIKPKQVSSLIVTKLESASTSKAALITAATTNRRRAAEKCEPSTSTGVAAGAAAAAIKQKLTPAKRGRKPKPKVLIDTSQVTDSGPTTPTSSSNDSFEEVTASGAVKQNQNQRTDRNRRNTRRTRTMPESEKNSTIDIDLKENLDASAVTLPLPAILDNDCIHNSTDDSFVVAEEDVFSVKNHSSDESTTGSLKITSKGKKADEISLFGRSNSTDTTSSDGSEMMRRKLRISVKRCSLTPQKSPQSSQSPSIPQSPQFPQSPLASITEPKEEIIDLLSSTNDEASNEVSEISQKISKKTRNPKANRDQSESCATPPIIVLTGNTSNATSVESGVIEIVSWNSGTQKAIKTPTEETSSSSSPSPSPSPSPSHSSSPMLSLNNTRRGRSRKLNDQQESLKTQTQENNFKCLRQPNDEPTSSEKFEKIEKISLRNRKQSLYLPIAETNAASVPSTSSLNAQLMESLLPSTKKQESPLEINQSNSQKESIEDSSQVPKGRNLRSTQAGQVAKIPTPVLKKQRKSNKIQATEPIPPENNDPCQMDTFSEKESIPNEVSIVNDSSSSLEQETQPKLEAKKEENLTSAPNEKTNSNSTTKHMPKTICSPTSTSNKDSSTESSDGHEKSLNMKNLRQKKLGKNCVVDDKSKDETSSLCSESSSVMAYSSSASTSSSSTASSKSVSSSSSASASSSEGRSTRSTKKLQNNYLLEEQDRVDLEKSITIQSQKSDSECSGNTTNSKTMQRRWSSDLEREESESSDVNQRKPPKTHSGKSRGRSRGRVEKLRDKESESELSEVKSPKKTNETTETIINQQINTMEPSESSDASTKSRSKSKKRTRRFVPIKYSSSESGSLSDDGSNSQQNIGSIRMTRTRRKTISSASELEELPSGNLSPPDLALEYLPRKSKHTRSKVEAKQEKEENENKNEGVIESNEEISVPKAMPLLSGARRKTINSSLNSTEVEKESENHLQSSETLTATVNSSTEEEQISVPRQRTTTRLSRKIQNDSRIQKATSTNESSELTLSYNDKNLSIVSSAEVEKEKEEPKHDEKPEETKIQTLNDTPLVSDEKRNEIEVEKSEESKTSKSPKQRKTTKSSTRSPKMPVNQNKTQQIETENEKPSEGNIIENVSSTETNDNGSTKETTPTSSSETVEVNKDFEIKETVNYQNEEQSAEMSQLSKPSSEGEPLSVKETDAENIQNNVSVTESKQDLEKDFVLISIDEVQSKPPVKTPRVRKPTRFSAISPKEQKNLEHNKPQDEQQNSQSTNLETDENLPENLQPQDGEQTKVDLVNEKPLSEKSNSGLTEDLKQEKTPKNKKKSNRLSPKTPDKPKIDQQTNQDEKTDEPSNISVEDELSKVNEINNVATTPPVLPVKSPRVRKPTRFSPKNPEISQLQVVHLQSNEHEIVEKIEEPPKPMEPVKAAPKGRKVGRPPKNAENSQIEVETKKTIDDSEPSVNEEEKLIRTPKSKKTTKVVMETSDSSNSEIISKVETLENKSPEKVEDQIDQTNETISNSLSTETASAEETAVPSEEDKNKESDFVENNQSKTENSKSGSIYFLSSTETPDRSTKRGIQKQLHSMLKLITKAEDKKETTPRRKKKSIAQQQESTSPPQDNSISNKSEELEQETPSTDSNQPPDESLKPNQEDTTKVLNKKQTPRRKLDSSFIESLEKSLLKSAKKTSKKKEKDKEVTTQPAPNMTSTPKEDSTKKSNTNKKTVEQLANVKKTETSSPKLKKKQPKESPKVDKKCPGEEQTPSKRKSFDKPKKLEETKGLENLETSLAYICNDEDTTNKLQTPEPVHYHPQPLKTKAETKFFSPEKPPIECLPTQQPLPLELVLGQVETVKEKSPDLLPDPLKDIEKFIEDGVNLLKRSYKIDADDDASLDRDLLKSDEIITSKKCKLDESLTSNPATEEEQKQTQQSTPPDDDNSNSNSECSTLTSSLTNTSISEIDTPNGIRRSHRIKNNSKTTKCLVGRGLVRERERFSMKDDEKTYYSIDDQKMDLAEVEAKNSQFLKDMEERLSNFKVIRENEYKCERVISKEAKRMLCDCFLTAEEEERGELGCGEDCLNRLLMIECGTDCIVRERCTNRRFNKFLYSPCRVFRTEKKGFGIMADIEILPGEFIMEYVGEVINGDEFEIRINEYSKDKNKHYYFMALRSDAVIDATAKGNISRFINHSCDPNAETQKWTVNGELRIGFFSRKSIMPGEEITFDYQYQRYGKEAQKCYCESSNCRGWIGAEPSSEEEYEGVDDESEESEEEEQIEEGAAMPSIAVPSSIPSVPVVLGVADADTIVSATVVATEIPVISAEVVSSPQTLPKPTSPTPITSTPSPLPPPVQIPVLTKDSLPLVAKKKKEKKRFLEDKLKRREQKQFLEDPDIEDDVRFLVKCGLRNQADTLRLSRLIVRAKLLETRIKLLQILRAGELPCRRLFLDYHGLRLLHGWMSEVLDTSDVEMSMEIRMELLSVLECLPIPNKTMLTDSKVYQIVRDWSNNKESHSPSDGSPKHSNDSSSLKPPPPSATEDASSELQKLAAKLVHTWDNLPEVFRIPKRERIEQMKEHEREADRQYQDESRNDRNSNRERFNRKSGKKGRFNWSKEKERERTNERRKYAQNNNCGKDSAEKSAGPMANESQLSKEQRRELFAAKVARDEAEKRLAEERREFDIKCRFFGLDPKRVRPENMPFCVNPSTGQWYSTDKKPIATPPSYAHVQVPVKPKSTNPEDYQLPPMDLPPLWKFAISPKGKIYYYHVKIRIPQWEPPIKILPLSGQHGEETVRNSESDSSNADIHDSSEDDIEVIKGLDQVKLQAYIEKRIENRRLQRYNRLVVEKPISPRKEEDRIYNQLEVRKYKENKEKIRKRKEEIRRRRDIIGIPQSKPTNVVDSSKPSNESTESVVNESQTITAEPLPIQDYLLSSEEEDIKAECNNSPLIDKIVQGDKIVDELDALHRKRSLKRSLPIRDKYEHKKRKFEKNKESSKSTKRSKDGEGSSSGSSKYRKVREKFRCDIAGIIVQHLKPYRSETCFTGRILTDEDFNHLARKLTHFVMVKELKYCESIGQTLIVTESVKNKSREFIKKYMAKYGKVYVRPKNDPEFKDIPFL